LAAALSWKTFGEVLLEVLFNNFIEQAKIPMSD
jgi:hypothetical protein